VTSRNNPDFGLDIAVDCADHILVTGKATLRTEDGRLNETWTNAEMRTTTTGVRSLFTHQEQRAARQLPPRFTAVNASTGFSSTFPSLPRPSQVHAGHRRQCGFADQKIRKQALALASSSW
jgi:hypothetical protein